MKLLISFGTFFILMSLGLLVAELTSFFFAIVPFYLLFIVLTIYLCKKWDKYVIVRRAKKMDASLFDAIKDSLPEYVLHHCSFFRGDEKALRKFLRHCIRHELLNKASADIVFEEYKCPIDAVPIGQNDERQNPENTYKNYRKF